MEVVIGCFMTVISGTMVYIISRWYDEEIRKPIKRYYEVRDKIKYLLLLHANLYSNPLQLADNNSKEIVKRYSDASDDIRKLGAELSAVITLLPKTIGKKIPKKEKLEEVVSNLIGISNSFYQPYNVNNSEETKQSRQWRKEIEEILNI